MEMISKGWLLQEYYLGGVDNKHALSLFLFYFEMQCKIMKKRSKTMPLIALSMSSHTEGEADWTFCCRIIPDSITTF